MHFFRRFWAPLLGITALIGLSVFALVSLCEGFKFLAIRKEGVTLRKRDGTTITFGLPWKSALEIEPKAKALSPVFGSLLGDVTNVASAILNDGSNVANNVQTQSNAFQSKAMADGHTTQVSVVFDGGAGIVASILSDVNSIINDATGIIGGVVHDATSVVGIIIGGVTSTVSGQSTSASNTSTSSSEPQEFLPQSHSTAAVPAAMSALNMTSAALPSTPSSSAAPASAPCPTATTTITPCCPSPSTSTVTCTVTETWHSTHYEFTQTLYSFMSIFTVTCTETVSVCPPSNPYLFSQNATMPPSSNPYLIACANGVLAKHQEDCPTASMTSQPANMSAPCSMMAAGPSSYSGGNPIPSVASLMLNAGGNVSSSHSAASSSLSTMVSFTASLPSLSSTALPVSTIVSLIASIVCSDGTLVIHIQDCLNGLSGSTKPASLLAFRTSPAPFVGQATAAVPNAAEIPSSLLSNMVVNIVSALSNVQGLTGDILSSVIADFTSTIRAANTLTGDTLPTVSALAAADLGGAPAAAAGIIQTITGNAVPSVTGVLAIANADPVAAAAVMNGIAQGLPTNENAVARGGVAASGNIVDHLATTVNGIPTLLPIVRTMLDGRATTVPVVDMVMNGATAAIPVVNDRAGLLAGLNGGVVKGRRRIVNRAEPEVGYYCEKNPMDEPCLPYRDGGGLKREGQL